MKRLIGLVIVLVLGVAGPAWGKRDDGDERKRGGCSKEHWHIVLEREDVLRLCLFGRDR